MTLGERIRTIRDVKGIKQDELAKHVKWTQQNVSKLERDEIDVTVSKLKEIADILNVSVNDLLSEDRFVFNISHNTTGNGIVIHHISELGEKLHLAEERNRLLQDKITLLEEKNRWYEQQQKTQ